MLETRRYGVPIKRWKAIISAAANERVHSCSLALRGEERRWEKKRRAGKKKVSPTTAANSWHNRPRAGYADRRQVTALRHLRVHRFYSTFYRVVPIGVNGESSFLGRWERPTVVRGTDEIYLAPIGDERRAALVLLRKIGSRYVDSVRCHVNLPYSRPPAEKRSRGGVCLL